MAAVKKTVTMKADLDSLWHTITDYENYPKFIDNLESSKIIERKGNVVTVEYEVNLMKKISYILKHIEKPQKSMSWTMQESSFLKGNTGSWTLKATKEGVSVDYEVDGKMPMLVPKAVVNTLVASGLPTFFENIENQAKKSKKKKQ